MKAKPLAKRLLVRAEVFRQKASRAHDSGDLTATDRALLIMDVLQEIAVQIFPRKKAKKAAKKNKAAKEAAKNNKVANKALKKAAKKETPT